jgi:hypothetical protein
LAHRLRENSIRSASARQAEAIESRWHATQRQRAERAEHDAGMGLVQPLFSSFWMGGYEGADHVNGAGVALDMVGACGHAERLDRDYRAARRLGLRCLRESIGWRLAEQAPGCWDLARAVRMAQAAQRQGVQILWTLMHYGLPNDLSLYDDALIPRFARFAGEVARVLRPLCRGPRIYTPINEISFLSWIASATHDMGPAGRRPDAIGEPDLRDHGYLFKQRLVRAALAGMAAIRAQDPDARFLHVEPVVHVVPPPGQAEHRALAERTSSYQWQALDMLSGRLDPQLGGHPDAVDIVGLNHYHNSQWEVPSGHRLEWHLRDPRRLPVAELLYTAWQRYGRPLVIAETGHVGVGRAAWAHEVAGEARRALAQGVPLQGVCLYPLLDRPDWNDMHRWHRSGLWHLRGPGTRSLNRPYARALLAWQGHALPAAGDEPDRAALVVLLPCAWDDWAAPRDELLTALQRVGRVVLIEPPRGGACVDTVRTHSLAPGADLLVVHCTGAAGWRAPPDAEVIEQVRRQLGDDDARPPVCWLAGWSEGDHAGWWREAVGGELVLQPAAGAVPDAALLQRARRVMPPAWPGASHRPRRAQAYEADEVELLLSGVPTPFTWLKAPTAPVAQEAFSRHLLALAQQTPFTHWLVDAPAPPDGAPWPRNIHWRGRIDASLQAALRARASALMAWCDVTACLVPIAPTMGSSGLHEAMDDFLRDVVSLCDASNRQLSPMPQQWSRNR